MARELTRRELSCIRRLVREECANFDPDYGCLPLDSGCYMHTIVYTNSALCRYFREAVLPLDPELSAAFSDAPTRVCAFCGKSFPQDGKRKYCSNVCREAADRKKTALRVRKHRGM